MKTIIVLAMVMMASVAQAQLNCPPPTPPCPECQPVQVTCRCEGGGWLEIGPHKVLIKGRTRCGNVITNGLGFFLETEDKEYFVIDKPKVMEKVESCE